MRRIRLKDVQKLWNDAEKRLRDQINARVRADEKVKRLMEVCQMMSEVRSAERNSQRLGRGIMRLIDRELHRAIDECRDRGGAVRVMMPRDK